MEIALAFAVGAYAYTYIKVMYDLCDDKQYIRRYRSQTKRDLERPGVGKLASDTIREVVYSLRRVL